MMNGKKYVISSNTSKVAEANLFLFFLPVIQKTVHKAINAHRLGLDKDPYGYFVKNFDEATQKISNIAGKYLGVDAKEIAWTDCTTTGISILYNGLLIGEDQEILTTHHEHYSTKQTLKFRTKRIGTKVRTISLYKDLVSVTKEEIIKSIIDNIQDKTRVLALTWVDSSTGLKFPIHEISKALAKINCTRKEENKVLFCVDGVHGFGIENIDLKAMGCDFFIAGCHKWLFGPRGTGLLWGKKSAWKYVVPMIPSFLMVEDEVKDEEYGIYHTPGGFKSYEHYWALDEAFRFHLDIGKNKIEKRIHSLNSYLKEGLSKIPGVVVHTPMSPEFSAGFTTFEIAGKKNKEVQKFLESKHIYASIVNYGVVRYLRMAPGLLCNEQQLDKVISIIDKYQNC